MRWMLVIGFMLSSISSIWAGDLEVYPPTGLQPFLGLDDTSVPTRVQPGRASTLQNVRIGLTGDLRKRVGLKVIGETLDAPGEDFCTVTGLIHVPFSGGTSRTVAICGQRASYLNGAAFTDISNTVNATLITAGQNNQFVFTPALANLIATNDADAPAQWAGGADDFWLGVSFSGLTAPIQKAKVATFFQNYLIFGNTQENGIEYPTRIRWGNVGTINTWTDADYVDVDASAGQELNCIGQLYGDVYLGFTSSLYRMSLVGGSGTFAFTKVSNEVGCVAKNSLQQITFSNSQTGLIFLDSKKRVYFFNGTVPMEVSRLIHTTLNAVNGARLQYAVSAEDGEHYYLCLSNGGALTNNLCLDYNYQIGEWSKSTFTGLTGMNAMAKVIDSSTISQVYVGTGDSFVYQLTETSLDNDVGGASGTVDSVSRYPSIHASSLQVLYDASASYTASGLIGAPIELVGGGASGLIGVIVDNTSTGLIVARDFSTTPDSTTTFEVGRINAYYTTRWDDFGDPSWIKQGIELFLVADADIGSTLDVGYGVDFQSNTATPTASLTPSEGSLWGTAIWGTAVWGGGDIVFIGSSGKKISLDDEGRWWRFTFTEDDRDENFRAHGWQVLYDRVSRN